MGGGGVNRKNPGGEPSFYVLHNIVGFKRLFDLSRFDFRAQKFIVAAQQMKVNFV